MPVFIPEFPYDLESNKCYLRMCDDYSRKIYWWRVSELRQDHGAIAVKYLLKHDDLFVYCDMEKEVLQPAFLELSTTTNEILRCLSDRMRSFRELRALLPEHVRQEGRLKNLIAYLWNFAQVQYYTPPTSALTYIALEGFSEVEDDIDRIFHAANGYGRTEGLEPRFRYQVPPIAPDPAGSLRLQL